MSISYISGKLLIAHSDQEDIAGSVSKLASISDLIGCSPFTKDPSALNLSKYSFSNSSRVLNGAANFK